MARLFLLLALFASITLPMMAVGQQTVRFLTAISDMPLMPGLAEVPDALVTFDSPSGRIIEALAIGNVSTASIRSFYLQTLPQLGWVFRDGKYIQGSEVLRLDFIIAPFSSVKGGVRFVLRPLKRD